jgi:RNA polymerase sigma-54 factor
VRANLTGPAIDAQLRAQVEAKLLPGVLQTLALLQSAHSDVEATVEAALRENPMLERSPGHPCPGCGRHVSTARCRNCARHSSAVNEPTVSPFETLGVLAGCEVHAEGRRALPVVLDHLTDRGLLDADPEQIAEAHCLRCTDVAEAIRAIKAVGPLGVAERSVPDLLAAQASELVQRGTAPAWILPLVRKNLDLVARDDVDEAARLFGTDRAAAAAVFSIVRRELRPVAGVESTGDGTPRRPPDFYVRRDESGALEIETTDSRWFGLRVADVSDEVRADQQAWQWLQKHEHAARMLLAQLDARASVLSQVAAVAVRRQREFIDRGPAYHVPLTRSDVARELGVHPSTVARAVCGKVIRTPGGEFIDFKDLFGSGVAVRAEIAELLRDSASSDAQLCIALRARGYSVARRTVAKYRAQLGIPAANRS